MSGPWKTGGSKTACWSTQNLDYEEFLKHLGDFRRNFAPSWVPAGSSKSTYSVPKLEKVRKDEEIRHLVVKKTNEKQVFRIIAKKNEIVTNIIEGWRISHNFDYLAFGNSVYESLGVRIREVQRIR